MGGRAGVGGPKTRARCKQGLLLCSVAIATLLGGKGGAGGTGAGSLRELGFSWVWLQSPLWLGAGLRPEDLRLHFCAGVTFSLVSAPWLEAGLGSEGLEPHSWVACDSSQVCAGTYVLAMTDPVMVRSRSRA